MHQITSDYMIYITGAFIPIASSASTQEESKARSEDHCKTDAGLDSCTVYWSQEEMLSLPRC